MDYLNSLKHAARLFRDTKGLWLLGIFAALFGQNEYSFSVSYSGRAPISNPESPDAAFADFFANPFVAAVIANPLPYILVAIAIALLWWLITALLGWLAQGAMIHLAAQADRNLQPSIRLSLRESRQQLWPMFLIYLLLSLPTLVTLLIAALLIVPLILSVFSAATPDPTIILPRMFAALLCLIPLFLLNGLAGVVLHILNTLAARSCMLQHLSVWASIRNAWLLFRRNLGYAVLNWFVLVMLGGLFGVFAAVPALLLLIPTAQAVFQNNWSPSALSSLVGLILYFIVVSLGIGGILTSFNSTVWTVLYQAFQQRSDAISI